MDKGLLSFCYQVNNPITEAELRHMDDFTLKTIKRNVNDSSVPFAEVDQDILKVRFGGELVQITLTNYLANLILVHLVS